MEGLDDGSYQKAIESVAIFQLFRFSMNILYLYVGVGECAYTFWIVMLLVDNGYPKDFQSTIGNIETQYVSELGNTSCLES